MVGTSWKDWGKPNYYSKTIDEPDGRYVHYINGYVEKVQNLCELDFIKYCIFTYVKKIMKTN